MNIEGYNQKLEIDIIKWHYSTWYYDVTRVLLQQLRENASEAEITWIDVRSVNSAKTFGALVDFCSAESGNS